MIPAHPAYISFASNRQAALGITNHKIDNSPLSTGRGRALLNEKTEKA